MVLPCKVVQERRLLAHSQPRSLGDIQPVMRGHGGEGEGKRGVRWEEGGQRGSLVEGKGQGERQRKVCLLVTSSLRTVKKGRADFRQRDRGGKEATKEGARVNAVFLSTRSTAALVTPSLRTVKKGRGES